MPAARTTAMLKEAVMSTEPTRSLPPRPNLDQQKKLAKELLASFRSGSAAAIARIRAHLPDKPEISLADVQFVIAREYGFPSWARLNAHIEALGHVGPDPVEQFREAVERRDSRAVRRILESDAAARAAIDRPLFAYGAPALVNVAGSGDTALIEALLDFGADPNRRSDWWAGGWHPLHTARGAEAALLITRGAVPDACAAAGLDRPELLLEILEEDPTRVHERGGDGQTPLHFARSRVVADMLLQHGADSDARDLDHRGTAAQWMLERRRGAGRYALAEYLVARGAEPDVFLAAALGLADRLREMLRADPTLLRLRTSQGEYAEQPPSSFHIYMWTIGANLSPLQVAAQFEQAEAIAVINEFAAPRERFLAACVDGRAGEGRAYLREHPTLVVELSPEEQRALPDAAWAGRADAVELMLELGFDPFTPGQDTGTVLHCAAWQGEVACARAVLRAPSGAALVRHREPTHGGTPIDWCVHGASHCRNPRGDYPAVAEMLLDAGSDPPASLDGAPAKLRKVIERRLG
jgi:ankyrin repeat protein